MGGGELTTTTTTTAVSDIGMENVPDELFLRIIWKILESHGSSQ